MLWLPALRVPAAPRRARGSPAGRDGGGRSHGRAGIYTFPVICTFPGICTFLGICTFPGMYLHNPQPRACVPCETPRRHPTSGGQVYPAPPRGLQNGAGGGTRDADPARSLGTRSSKDTPRPKNSRVG